MPEIANSAEKKRKTTMNEPVYTITIRTKLRKPNIIAITAYIFILLLSSSGGVGFLYFSIRTKAKPHMIRAIEIPPVKTGIKPRIVASASNKMIKNRNAIASKNNPIKKGPNRLGFA